MYLIFELIVFTYAVQFSMPVYTQPNTILIMSRDVFLSWESVADVLLLTILGVLVLIGSYSLAQRLPFVRSLPQIDLPLSDPRKKQVFIVGAIIIGGGISLVQAMGRLRGGAIGALVFLMSRQVQVAIALLAYDHYQQKKVIPA